MHPDRVEHFLNLSLEALQLDYIDLYLIHWPIALEYINDEDLVPRKNGKLLLDKTSSLELIWKGMEAQVHSGKVKSIGISNFTVEQIERIVKVATILPVNNQVNNKNYFYV